MPDDYSNYVPLAFLAGAIMAGLMFTNLKRLDEKALHDSLPKSIQPYDSNRDGVLQSSEIEKLLQERPEFQGKR
jgi:Ca2+-binding EF-hand superfamily protein